MRRKRTEGLRGENTDKQIQIKAEKEKFIGHETKKEIKLGGWGMKLAENKTRWQFSKLNGGDTEQ